MFLLRTQSESEDVGRIKSVHGPQSAPGPDFGHACFRALTHLGLKDQAVRVEPSMVEFG